MPDNIRTYITSFIIIAIFAISLLSFGIQFAADNNTNISIINNTIINRSFVSLNQTVASSNNDASVQRNATQSEIPDKTGESIVLVSIWTSILSFGGMVSRFANPLLELFTILGISRIVLGAFASMIVISLIFLGWKALRSGD